MQQAHSFSSTKGAAEVKLFAGAEKVVVESPPLITVAQRPEVQITVTCPFTTPLESTEQHLRIYRNKIGGTEVGSVIVKAGASAKTVVSLAVTDTPGDTAGVTYVATLQDIAGKETVAKEALIEVRH